MRITVQVKLHAKTSHVDFTNGTYTIFLHAPPINNKANRELIALLADYFHVSSAQVKIVHGITSRTKIVDIS